MPTNVRNLSDEVFPGILVGDKLAASNRYYLSKLGVTHVLNAAEGHNNRKGYVDTTKVKTNPSKFLFFDMLWVYCPFFSFPEIYVFI